MLKSCLLLDATNISGEMMYWAEWTGQKFAFISSTYAKASYPRIIAKFLEDRLTFD